MFEYGDYKFDEYENQINKIYETSKLLATISATFIGVILVIIGFLYNYSNPPNEKLVESGIVFLKDMRTLVLGTIICAGFTFLLSVCNLYKISAFNSRNNKPEFLFSWEDIKENILLFKEYMSSISWIKNADVKRDDENNIITLNEHNNLHPIVDEKDSPLKLRINAIKCSINNIRSKNSITLTIDLTQNKLIMASNDNDIYDEFIIKKENGKINIYIDMIREHNGEIKDIMKIQFICLLLMATCIISALLLMLSCVLHGI